MASPEASTTSYARIDTVINGVATFSYSPIVLPILATQSSSLASNTQLGLGGASSSTAAPNATPATSSSHLSSSTIISVSAPSATTPPSSATIHSSSLLTGFSIPANGTIQTSSPTTQASQKQNKTGYSAGAAAGFAVGFLILGALIAAAAFFALQRRRNIRQRRNGTGYDDKDLRARAALPLFAKQSPAVSVDEYLPQPKDDKTIIGDFSRLKSRIDNHVQTYYGNTSANPEAAAQAVSHAVGPQSHIPVGNLPALLADNHFRLPLLRAALSSVIVSRIGADAVRSPENSLLPPDMATTYSNMSRDTSTDTTPAAFFGKWRQITTTTAGDTYSKEQLDAHDPRLANIHKAMQTADSFLSYYAQPRDQQNRLRNLEEIIKRAARFDFLLFSQPADFRFDWSGPSQSFVVFPGLLQVSDEAGRAFPSPRVLTRAESAA